MERNNGKKYQYRMTLRLTPGEKSKLDKLLQKSAFNRNMSELLREMLFRQKLTINTYDASLGEVKEELTGIKKELRTIGVNINQVTHYFMGIPTL